MPKQSIPANAEGLSKDETPTAKAIRLAKELSTVMSEYLDGEFYAEVFPSNARQDAVSFINIATRIPPKPELKRNLIDGLDMLTLSRNIFHTLIMAAEELSDKEEREAFAATLDYGLTCLKDGIEYVAEAHGDPKI